MHIRAPMLKHLVMSSIRDNSAFTEVCDYLNIPTVPEGCGLKPRTVHTGKKKKKKKKKKISLFFVKIFNIYKNIDVLKFLRINIYY